jgi:hypothetical protein
MYTSLLSLVTIAGLVVSGLAAPVAELESRQSCADVIVVYARGTTQASPIGDDASVRMTYLESTVDFYRILFRYVS